MLKIRLQRVGRKNDPSFRLIVAEHTSSPKTGKFVEKVGTYNPKTKVRAVNADRIKHWLSVGAKASGTVHNMLVTEGVISGKKVNVLPKKRPIVKEEAPAETGAATATVVVEEVKDLPAQAGEPVADAPEAPAAEATADAGAGDSGAAGGDGTSA